MTMIEITAFLDSVVEKAWEEETEISRAFKMNLDIEMKERTATICQGITRNLERRLCGIFKCKQVEFDYKDKEQKHIVLLVEGDEPDDKWIVDGSIRQYLPDAKAYTYAIEDYPLRVDNPLSWK